MKMSSSEIQEVTTKQIELEKMNIDTFIAENEDKSNQVNVAINKYPNNANTNGELGQNKSVENNSFSEASVTEIRHFKCIAKPDAPNNSSRTDNLFHKESDHIPDDIGGDKRVLSSPHNTAVVNSGGNSNESCFPIYKLPTYKDVKYGKVELYALDTGPRIYNVKGNIVSRPIITKNLPQAFKALPVHGKADSKNELNNFFKQKIRDYVGYGVSDNEFQRLHDFMNGDYLRNGHECSTPYTFPSQGQLSADLLSTPKENGPGQHLCIVKKLQLRIKKDTRNVYPRKLKYRGLRMLPLSIRDENQELPGSIQGSSLTDEGDDGPLEPGRDLIFRARIYRPHSYGSKRAREQKPTRHSVFSNDLVILGRQRLTAFRDRIACPNDVGLRVDISDNPDYYATESAKHMFPSGFLFINNVFYVDKRPGCVDHSVGIREWARLRQLGDFPVRDMAAVRLDELVLRLGHPEVYIHQGKCEHLFMFSEVRLLSPTDPLHLPHYPCFTYISQNQSVYCTTCAEFGAKWIVVGCSRVPFDPAFFCDTCFRFYLYDINGKKIGDFKAYSYKGNMVNFMRPIAGMPYTENAQSDSEDVSEQ